MDQDRSHVRPTLGQIPPVSKNCAHLAIYVRRRPVPWVSWVPSTRRSSTSWATTRTTAARSCTSWRSSTVGQVVAARDGARPVAVARLGSGKLVVVADECPHDGGRISDGYVDGEQLVCARHGWELVACERPLRPPDRCQRARAGAACGRRARARTSPRRSAPRAAARTDRGGPWARAPSGLPSRSTVSCGRMIVAVGLNAMRSVIGSPFEMPPWMPPERFVRVPIVPSGRCDRTGRCARCR